MREEEGERLEVQRLATERRIEALERIEAERLEANLWQEPDVQKEANLWQEAEI